MKPPPLPPQPPVLHPPSAQQQPPPSLELATPLHLLLPPPPIGGFDAVNALRPVQPPAVPMRNGPHWLEWGPAFPKPAPPTADAATPCQCSGGWEPPPPLQPPPLPPQPPVLHPPSAQQQPPPSLELATPLHLLLPPPPSGGFDAPVASSSDGWLGQEDRGHGDAVCVDVQPGSEPTQGTTSAGAVAPARKTCRCHTPFCTYLVHSDEQFGSFCCLKCHWRFDTRSGCRRKHGALCEGRSAPLSAPVATFTAPFTAPAQRPSQPQANAGRPRPSDEQVISWPARLVQPKPPPPQVVWPTRFARTPLPVAPGSNGKE